MIAKRCESKRVSPILYSQGNCAWIQPSCSPVFTVLRRTRYTYIRDEGRLQHAGLQTFEVDVSEYGMGFDLRGSTSLAAQPLGGIFGQKLGEAV